MSSKMPPIPPENLSDKGAGKPAEAGSDDTHHGTHGAPDPARQGQQANTRINTSHSGNVQDR